MEKLAQEAVTHSENVIECRKSHHPNHVKKDLTTRLNRVEGQIRGIKGMIDKDVYCDDVITQLSAAQSALNSVAKILLDGCGNRLIANAGLDGHLHDCSSGKADGQNGHQENHDCGVCHSRNRIHPVFANSDN